MADFVLGRIKFVWKGDWTATTAYLADDVVKYGGNAFIAVVNHTSSSTFETETPSKSWVKEPSFPETFIESSWISIFTPSGTDIGLLPIRDIINIHYKLSLLLNFLFLLFSQSLNP